VRAQSDDDDVPAVGGEVAPATQPE
jgi:hypothetical protein